MLNQKWFKKSSNLGITKLYEVLVCLLWILIVSLFHLCCQKLCKWS